MPVIKIKFENSPELELLIDDSTVGQQYYRLVKENYNKEKPIYRDTNRYTMEYMISLVKQAKELLGWNWSADSYNLENCAVFHKDIEVLLGTVGFDAVPAEYDYLLHELHYGLHILEHGENQTRGGWLQIEWYNDEGFELDYNFEFQSSMKFGDVKLQNPWVGHGPLQMYNENDFINISQTCKFHDFVKPGLNISITDFPEITFYDEIVKLFKQHDPEFVKLHGEGKIRHYTGYPIVGRVLNLDDLKQTLTNDILILEYLSFND